MADPALPRALAERIAAIGSRHRIAETALLAEMASAVASAVEADVAVSQAALLREVESLGHTIAAARAEIAALGAAEITGRHIPDATDELDAIVSHTAAATDIILESCETLDAVAAGLGEPEGSHLRAATTAIYEACSFQDITGQRITKVVAALKAIDAKVVGILAADQRAPTLPDVMESLASGPQLPAAAMGQDDVDQLLARLG